jgi:hypothetical protein
MWTNPDVARALAARVAEERASSARALRVARAARVRARALQRALEILMDEYGAFEAPYAAMSLILLEASSASEDAERAALFG